MAEQTWHGACSHVARGEQAVGTVTARVVAVVVEEEPSFILCDVCAACYDLCREHSLTYSPSASDPRRGTYSLVTDA